jgi:hypothetical protein
MALSTLGTLGAILATAVCVWTAAAGCNGLSKDCELNLTCPTTSAASSSGTGTGGGDAGPSCIDVFVAGACNTCLETSCCQSIIDCKADAHCLYCLDTTIPNDPLCTSAATQKVVNTFYGCDSLHCATACVAADTCNPITNDGCGTDGSACDLGLSQGTFQCFPPPNSAQLCGVCDDSKGPYCAPGLHCYPPTLTCARYCCSDADCGSGVCELDPTVALGGAETIAGDMAGICLTMLVPDGGADGGADGGGASPACDAPATSTTKGACVAGFPPM